MKDKNPLSRIAGIEDYFPSQVITNDDLSKVVDTNDTWIRERTGISERRRSLDHETPSYMGIEASKTLLSRLKVDPKELDLILCATITPDHTFPASACLIQSGLGATKAFAYDINAACSGFLYTLDTAHAFIASKRATKVLVVAAEKMSAILNFKDRASCIIFGDGGSATLVEPSDDRRGWIDSLMRTDGSGIHCLYSKVGGSRYPATPETIAAGEHYVYQDGRSVFKRAVIDMADIASQLLIKNNVSVEAIDLFVPHQANLRIIEAACERLKMPIEKTAINLDRFGNTTAATIPTALRDAERKGQVKQGDLVLLASFGAGFTWGATLLRY